MKVFVTGGTGFVGSHVVKKLLDEGHDVRLFVRNKAKAEALLNRLDIPVVDIVEGEISDRKTVSHALIDCNAVIHSAAATPLQNLSTAELLNTNVNGVKSVIGSACEQCLKHIVYVSSVTAVFQPGRSETTADSPVVHTSHPYGKSKGLAENYIRDLQAQGLPVKSVYPGGIVGPGDPGHSATVMALWYRVTQGFKVTSGGTQQIDVRDLASIIVALMAVEDGKPGRYMTVGHFMTWKKFALLLESIIGRPLKKQVVPGWFLRMIGLGYDFKRLFVDVTSPISAETMSYTTQWRPIENDPCIKAMKLRLRSPRETFHDTLEWMLQTGMLKPQDAPALSKSGTT